MSDNTASTRGPPAAPGPRVQTNQHTETLTQMVNCYPDFSPRVELFLSEALRPAFPLNAVASPCQDAHFYWVEHPADARIDLKVNVSGWFGLRISSAKGALGTYELKKEG